MSTKRVLNNGVETNVVFGRLTLKRFGVNLCDSDTNSDTEDDKHR